MVNDNDQKIDKSCRFYEDLYPKQDELVVVRVNQVSPLGAYVSLLEYNNKEGMVLLSELSRKRIRSVSKLIRVGKIEHVVVLRVDKEKGYIDLSRRRRNDDDIKGCEERYQNSRKVHGLMFNVAKKLNLDAVKPLYEKVIWPLYHQYNHAILGLYEAVTAPEKVFEGILDHENNEEDKRIYNAILSVVRRKLKRKPTKVRTDFELTCFDDAGIDGVKDALRSAANMESPNEIEIYLVAPPIFVMTTVSTTEDQGVKILNKALDIIKTKIESVGGVITVREAPRSISDDQDRSMNQLFKQLQEMNKEVAADSDDDDFM